MLAVVLALLVCAGHGRRLRKQASSTTHSFNQLSESKGLLSSLRVGASSLTVFSKVWWPLSPAVGWHICHLSQSGRISANCNPMRSHSRSLQAGALKRRSVMQTILFGASLQVRERYSKVFMNALDIFDEVALEELFVHAAENTFREELVNYTHIYTKIEEKLREINSLSSVANFLRWDQLTLMPSGAAESRVAQESVLYTAIHEKQVDQELGKLLEILKNAPDGELNEVQKAIVHIEYERFNSSKSIPKPAVQHLAELKADANNAWEEYNRTNDYSKFAVFFQDLVDTSVEVARCIDCNRNPYDVLLQTYEKGMSSERLQEIFDEVSTGLKILGAELERSPYWPDASWLNGTFDIDLQDEISRQISLDFGFDTDIGRMDVVPMNPFTIGLDVGDTRLTTWYTERDISVGLTNTIHETGHGLYEQGRNTSPEWQGLSISNALSTGVHESQSFFWERMVGRGKPFQRYLLPKLQKAFPNTFKDRTWDELYVARNHWETEEIVFMLRTMIFFDLERDLILGKIKAIDIPHLWDSYHDEMREQLGMAEGRVDMHKWCALAFPMPWMLGAFGYLPTYALGAMYACQIFEHVQSKIPDLDDAIEKGEFTEIRHLLNKDIHELGSLPATSEDLLEHATGSKLNTDAYLLHLIQKYSEIYL